MEVGMNLDLDVTQKELTKFRRQLLGAIIIGGFAQRSSLFSVHNTSDKEAVKKWVEFLEESYV
jgi:hypothetical protein